ncbi:hypothetical protein MHLNE_08930 [Moorella humiferrea]
MSEFVTIAINILVRIFWRVEYIFPGLLVKEFLLTFFLHPSLFHEKFRFLVVSCQSLDLMVVHNEFSMCFYPGFGYSPS